VRITAKIPEYLACGRFIVATDVGGARQFVKEAGVLLPVNGVKDDEYIGRIAGVVEDVVADRDRLLVGRRGVDVARRYFDYGLLRLALQRVLDTV